MDKISTNTKNKRQHQGINHNRGRKERPGLIIFYSLLILGLVSCQAGQAATVENTPTASPNLLPANTATVTATVTATPTPTLTPEPSWYERLDPAFGTLQFQYAEVVNEHARIYASFDDAIARNGNYGHLPNFPAYVAYTTTRTGDDGVTYFLVHYGWMSGKDLKLLTPSSFSGIKITRPVDFRFGWVLQDTQSVNAAGETVQSYPRYQVVHEVPTTLSKPGYLAIGPDEWLPEGVVALVSPQVPADAGTNTHRFIYVNLATQTLAVYDADALIFATLISSGKNSWTFEGRFAILYKVDYSSITPPSYSTSDYYIEGVPYFMTYAGNFGFHGAYWHDAFGTAASHGCINLSPTDAKWLYDWAGLGERVIISAGN